MTKKFDILALGSAYVDINVDNFPFSADGIPTEIELIGNNYEVVPGGSALNFCLFLAKLGLRPVFIGMAGDDAMGGHLKSLLAQAGVQAHLVQKPQLKTAIGFNMTNTAGQHIMLVAGDANAALTPGAVMGALRAGVAESSMLFLGGCFKLKAFAHAYPAIVDLARQSRSLIIVDHNRIPDGTTAELLETVKTLVLGADYYLPSRDEFCQLWNVDSIETGLGRLYQLAPNLRVVVKDGANGAYYWEDKALRHVPALPISGSIEVTGAGDSFNAGVIAALLKNAPIKKAVAYGCKVAVAKITRQQSIPEL